MNWWTRNGGGISSYTYSVLPVWTSRTKTPEVQNETLVTQHPTAPLMQRVPTTKRLQKRRPPPPARPDDRTPGSSIMTAKLVNESQTKFTSEMRDDAYKALVRDNPHYFADTKHTEGSDLKHIARSHLEGVLESVRLGLGGPNPNLPEELRGAEMMVLTQALAQVSKNTANGVADVVRGLNCLRNIDLLAAIRDPAAATPAVLNAFAPTHACPNLGFGPGFTLAHADASYDHADFDCAWRLAQALGGTPTGFQLLKKITRPLPDDIHVSVKRFNDEMLHVFLDGTRALANEDRAAGRPIRSDPYAVFHHISQRLRAGGGADEAPAFPGRGNAPVGPTMSLLEKGLLTVKDYLDQSNTHATGDARQVAFAPRANAYAWAAAAIRNGLYTDARTYPDGRPTLFAKIEGRTHKMASGIQSMYNRPTGGLRKWKQRLKETFVPQVDKSPINAFHRLGKGDLAIGFKQSENMGGIKEGRIMKQHMIDNLINGLKTAGGGTDAHHRPLRMTYIRSRNPYARSTEPTSRELRSLARLAILEQTKESTLFLTRYKDGDPLNEIELEKAQRRAYEYLARGGTVDPSPETSGALQFLMKQENQGYTPDTMLAWAGDVGGPAISEEVQAQASQMPDVGARVAAGQPDWRTFSLGYRRVVNSEVNISPAQNRVKNPDNMNTGEKTTELAARFEEAIAGQELGSRFSFSSGGVVGIKTGGFTKTLSTLFMGGLWRAKVNIAADRARTAVFEAGTGTAGNELVFATERANVRKLGVGGGVTFGHASKNFDAGVTIGLGASLDGNYTHEDIERRGAVFRFRRLYTGVPGDDINNARLGRVARKIMDPHGAESAGGWVDPGDARDQSILKRVLQEFPDISVSWMGTDESAHRGDLTISASVGLSVLGVGVGVFGLGLGGELRKSKQKWTEQGGSLHVDKYTTSRRAIVNGRLSSPGVSTNVAQIALPGNALDGALTMPVVEAGGVSADLWKRGFAQRDTLISEDGEFKKVTFRTRTFLNVAQLQAHVLPELHRMAADKAKKYEKPRYHPDLKPGEPPVELTAEQAQKRQEERTLTIRNEYEKMMQYLKRQESNAKPNQTFQVYYEPKDEVVFAVNQFKSLRKGALEAGDGRAVRQIDRRIKRMLEDESSWEYSFLIDFDSTSNTRWRGFNFIGKQQKLDSATFTRIRDYT
jgi:hypothetical protein